MTRQAALLPIALAFGMATLVPGASAQEPTPIKACQTISKSGSYELANNLVATSGDCLVIAADFVTVDLNGFSITGSDSTVTINGITGTPPVAIRQGIAVRNGSVFGFVQNVFLNNAEASIVEGLRIGGSIGEIGIIIGSGIVRGNTVGSGCAHVGISASGTVTGNCVTGCGEIGLSFTSGIAAAGTVSGNTVVNNRTIGLSVDHSTVIGNTATNNAVGISAICPSNLTDNTAVDNGTNLVLNGEGCNNTNNVAP